MKLVIVCKEVKEIRWVDNGYGGWDLTMVAPDGDIPSQFLVNTSPTVMKGSSSSGNYGHSGRPGKIGGSGVRLDILPYGMDTKVDGILSKYNLEKYKDKIAVVSDKMPKKGYTNGEGYWLNKTTKNHAIGVCVNNNDGTYTIHVHTDLSLDPIKLEKTLIHEIGHMAFMELSSDKKSLMYEWHAKVKQAMYDDLGWDPDMGDKVSWLKSLRLRPYSMGTMSEFAADLFSNNAMDISTFEARSMMFGEEDAHSFNFDNYFEGSIKKE